MTTYKTVETGLPFYGDITKQARYKPYFNAYLKEWIVETDYLPSFQFYGYEGATGLTNLDLYDADTGLLVTSYLAHFNTYGGATGVGDINKYYHYPGTQTVTVNDGRYYLYAKDDLLQEWWSEVFIVRDLNITANANTEFRTIETGVPFFDNINNQTRNKPYYNSSIKEWLTEYNRFPSFQFAIPSGVAITMVSFDLMDADTDTVVSDQMSYFLSNAILTDRGDDGKYYTHMGKSDVVIDEGRYYFYAENITGIKWWSEVFVMCGNITATTDFLLISNSDYLLIGGTDKLIIG